MAVIWAALLTFTQTRQEINSVLIDFGTLQSDTFRFSCDDFLICCCEVEVNFERLNNMFYDPNLSVNVMTVLECQCLHCVSPGLMMGAPGADQTLAITDHQARERERGTIKPN